MWFFLTKIVLKKIQIYIVHILGIRQEKNGATYSENQFRQNGIQWHINAKYLSILASAVSSTVYTESMSWLLTFSYRKWENIRAHDFLLYTAFTHVYTSSVFVFFIFFVNRFVRAHKYLRFLIELWVNVINDLFDDELCILYGGNVIQNHNIMYLCHGIYVSSCIQWFYTHLNTLCIDTFVAWNRTFILLS